jgi:hypothetical protein
MPNDNTNLVEHVNLPPRRSTHNGAKMTFGVLDLIVVLKDGNALT